MQQTLLTATHACLVMCFLLAGTVPAQPPRLEPDSSRKVSVDIVGMEVAEAMQLLSDATGFNILVSGKVSGKVTAYILNMEPERALRETVEINGFHYVRSGDVVWVLSDEEYFEDFDLGRVRRVIPLHHARAADVVEALAAVTSKQGELIAYPETNVVVAAEREERVAELEGLIASLDVPPATRVFQVQCAAAQDMLPLLQAHVPSPDSLKADPRTNQIMVTGTEESLRSVESLLAEFDKPDKVATRVFRLKYANADETADLLREVLTGRKKGVEGAAPRADGQEERPRLSVAQTKIPSGATPSASWKDYKAGAGKPAPTPPPTSTPSPGGAAPPALPKEMLSAKTSAKEETPVGALASVVADPRTNSVIVTHVEAVLDRLAQIIDAVDVPSDFHVYRFQNVNPADLDLDKKLVSLLPTEKPFLNTDPISRKVTFRSPQEKAQEILALLQQWDEETRQVRIEAEILSAKVSLIRDLGVNWEAVLNRTKVARKIPRLDAEVNFPANVGSEAPQSRLRVGTLENADYQAVLQAIETDSDTQIIASPRILVRDGQQATFSSVRDEPFTVVTVDANTRTTLEDVRFLNVGVSLAVGPTINQNNLVTLDVQLEISNLVEVRNGIPVVDRATAQSSVSVGDGGTIILGGLRQHARTQAERGVPGLRKAPLIGGLFRNRRRDGAEFEIVLVLRPTITGKNEDSIRSLDEVHDQVQSDLRKRPTRTSAGDSSSCPSGPR